SSRPYFGENRIVEGGKSQLSYIEVTNAQHFDAFLGFPGYSNRYVPLHVYFNRAMDLMYAHLKQGAPLPGSQVVRTIPRAIAGGVVAPITDANVPPIRIDPPAADRITFANDTVTVPD
ncbi:MAG: 3-hydroxybutyrate oligomer hydrolase family protein, partial [Burkholderiaceae bacterium]